MNIDFVVVGKTTEPYIQEGINRYAKRIGKYVNFNIVVIPELKNTKNLPEQQKREKEGELLYQQLAPYDYVVLLDERGKELTSIAFSTWIQHKANLSIKRMALVIGGAYGFSDKVYALSNEKLSLSKMTFSHQIIRLLFAEQLYRAFTILNNEPYHHE